jgi:hypothetical protein
LLFFGETEIRHTFCFLRTSCAGTPYDTAKRRLADDFSQNISPRTPQKKLLGVQEPFRTLFFTIGKKCSPPILNSQRIFKESKNKVFFMTI